MVKHKNKNFIFAKYFIAVLALALGFSYSSAWAGYTDKSYHEGELHTYKHPGQASFTGPFDYGSKETPSPAVEPSAPEGKCNCFTFDGTKSYDPDREKLTYAWNFGDGNTSDQPVVKHCYDKAGEYNVTLTVTDSSGHVCGNGVTSTKVNANYPPVAKAGENKEACLGEAISFDGSGSTASSATPKYSWDFGDGETGDGVRVSHNYQKPGTYRVRLTVDDGKGTECSVATDSINAVVTERASVKLEGPKATCVGNSAHFEANGSGVSKYTWDFGDGTTAEGGSSATHTYEKGGTYTVRVTGDSGHGGSCAVASDSTTIKVNSSPIAKAGQNLACCVDKDTTFDGSGSSSPDGRQLSYHWDFGDGESADGAKVTHAYKKNGQYRVILTVKDDSGSDCSSASDSFTADVNGKPEAVIEVR